MTKDKQLEDLFLAAKPKFDDKDRFMKSLTRRLDAVEYIKQHEDTFPLSNSFASTKFYFSC